jgi:hypothetical protein
MAWLTGWSYRKSIPISRASGAVTDYQMQLLVGESSGATGEAVDCDGKCKSDFSDIRFTTSDGTTDVKYWIESISGTTPNQLATIWIKFPSIGTGDTTFYMYYGKADATAVSNGTNTFPFFDDFSTSWNNPTKWTGNTADFSVSDGILTGTAGKYIYGNVYLEGDVVLQARTLIHHADGEGVSLVGSTGALDVVHQDSKTNDSAWVTTNDYSSYTYFSTLSISEGNYHIYELIRIESGTDSVFGKVDGTSTESTTSNITTGSLRVRIRAASHTDWIFAKTYLSTEPAWGAWGSEENSPVTFKPQIILF